MKLEKNLPRLYIVNVPWKFYSIPDRQGLRLKYNLVQTMFSMMIFICWFLLLQLPINISALHHEYNLQDGILNHGLLATYVQPQEKTIFEPQDNYESIQLLNKMLGIKEQPKVQNNLDSVIDWLKRIVTTPPPGAPKALDHKIKSVKLMQAAKLPQGTKLIQDEKLSQETRLAQGEKLAQFVKLLQRNDDTFQKRESSVLNSQAYLSIVQKLLQRLDKPAITKNMHSENLWNNKILAQYTDNLLQDTDSNGYSDHVIIQALRLLLRSIDKNMDRLDQSTNYNLIKKLDDKKKMTGVIGTHSIILQKIN